MNTCICTDIAPNLTLHDAANALHIPEDFLEEFDGVFQKCMVLARPSYCFTECPVEICGEQICIGNMRFDSRILRINLRNVQRAFPSLITCGREMHDFSRNSNDPLVQFWIDCIAEMMMEQAGRAMRRRLREICRMDICAVSPGSLGDFPLIEQKKLFHLLGVAPKKIGVELTPQCLMLPTKSASAIYFESDGNYENCMLCLRDGCPKRRAAFDAHALVEKYGLCEADIRQIPGR